MVKTAGKTFQPEDGSWQMWAEQRSDGIYWYPGSRQYVEMHGGKQTRPVLVSISEDGPYWGWLKTGEAYPSMIWPREILFRACFDAEPEAEEVRGKGRILRLSIEPVGPEVKVKVRPRNTEL